MATDDEPLVTDAEIGARLRDARQRAGLSQADLAQALAPLGLRLHQTQVSAVEKGERPLRATELVAFARVLGAEPAIILGNFGGSVMVAMPHDEQSLALTFENLLFLMRRHQAKERGEPFEPPVVRIEGEEVTRRLAKTRQGGEQ